MKKLIITLLAAVLASGAFAQTSFPDIPANHWAGDAVERIADLGIVIGFPDGTFRGNEAFTRYQAALVVSRMLDVMNDSIGAATALTQADIDSLRNAVQELASDVAAQGVRLAAAESAVAGLSDDSAATNARIDDLEAALANAGGMDPAVLRDLQNQLASQRVAIDTAQATADAAAARADAAYSLARQANTLARGNADDIANANRVLQLLQNDINDLKAAGGVEVDLSALDEVASLAERNRFDIANLQELFTLLRRDQVALRDQVSDLAGASAAHGEDIADLQSRVTALEENPLGVSGSITLNYYVDRVLGYSFDVDRVYGLNSSRDMNASVFSSGVKDLNGDDVKGNKVGERAQDLADFGDVPGTSGDVDATLKLAVAYSGKGLDGQGSPRGLNSFTSVITFKVNACSVLGTCTNSWFEVDEWMTTFSPIGAAPLEFAFGTNVETTFTPYVVGTDDPGFVASLTAPDFLSFLDPTITAFYITPDVDAYTRGARLTLSPLSGLTVGGSFAQRADNAGDKDDVNADNSEITVFGADAEVSLSIFDLGFEWASGTGAVTDESILYATLHVDGEGLPILDSVDANYRMISNAWETTNGYNLGADSDDYPFAEDQTGFGAGAKLNLFNIVGVDGYFDNYDVTAGDSAMSFGADLSANLFAGFSLTGWYHSASVNGQAVDSLKNAYNGSEALVAANIERDNNFDTSFGAGIKHDGSADNALLKGLNLSASYSQSEADFSRTTIKADADYTLNVSIVELTPYVGFLMSNDTDTVQAGDSYKGETTVRAGAGLQTAPLGVFLSPSLVGAVNYRTSSYENFGGTTWDADELQWSVGLVLNEFILPNSSLTAKYGSWTGNNLSNALNTLGSGDSATDISAGVSAGTGQQSTSGWEVIWDYWDLEFAYGVYTNSDSRGAASAQAFSISYAVTF